MKDPIKFTIELMQQTAGKNNKDIADILKIKPPTYTQYLNSNFQSLIRFISIADHCGYKTVLINEDKKLKLNLTKLLKDSETGSINSKDIDDNIFNNE